MNMPNTDVAKPAQHSLAMQRQRLMARAPLLHATRKLGIAVASILPGVDDGRGSVKAFVVGATSKVRRTVARTVDGTGRDVDEVERFDFRRHLAPRV